MPFNISVSKDDLEIAIKTITKKARARDPNVFEMSYQNGVLTCQSLDALLGIPANGTWAAPIAVSGFAMKKIATQLPAKNPLNLRYEDGRFFIEGFSIPASITSGRPAPTKAKGRAK